MSGYLSRLPLVGTFNGTGAAGPRRLLTIAAGGVLIVGAIFAVASIQTKDPPVSHPGALPLVDLLPGGLHSNPQQDTLGLIDNQEKAVRAEKAGIPSPLSCLPAAPTSRRRSSRHPHRDPWPPRPLPRPPLQRSRQRLFLRSRHLFGRCL